jgi:hypothetical protein
MFISILSIGCGTFFSERKPPKVEIARHKHLTIDWLVLDTEPPLRTTANIHLIGLKLNDVKGWADEDHKKIQLTDGSDLQIDVELIDINGNPIPLFVNGIGEYVEFGKRSQKEDSEGPDFQLGETFNNVRLRSSKPVDVEEIVWMEFEF